MSLKTDKKKLLDAFRNPETGELDASRWTQGYYARDRNQVTVDSDSPNAVSWCLAGAFMVSGLFNSYLYHCLVAQGWSIVAWNDHPARTFKEVIARIDSIEGDLDSVR